MVCLSEKVTEYKEDALCVVKIQSVKLFDVEKIFDCGQSFRFDRVVNSKHEKEFSGAAFGRYISVAQDGNTVYIFPDGNLGLEHSFFRRNAFVSYDGDGSNIQHRRC